MAGGFQNCAEHQTACWEGIFRYCMIFNINFTGCLHALRPAAAHSFANQFAAHTVSDQFAAHTVSDQVAGHTVLTQSCRAKHSILYAKAVDDLPEGLLVKGADLVVHAGVPLLVNGHPALPFVPDIRAGHCSVGVVGQSVLICRSSQPRRPCCKQPWVHLHIHRTDTDAAANLSCRLCMCDTVVDKIVYK